MASKKQKYNVKQFEKTILVFEAIKFHEVFFAHFQRCSSGRVLDKQIWLQIHHLKLLRLLTNVYI